MSPRSSNWAAAAVARSSVPGRRPAGHPCAPAAGGDDYAAVQRIPIPPAEHRRLIRAARRAITMIAGSKPEQACVRSMARAKAITVEATGYRHSSMAAMVPPGARSCCSHCANPGDDRQHPWHDCRDRR
jgi:hypothetical protein